MKGISVASRKAKGRRLQNWVAQKIGELLSLPWGYDEMIAPREMGQSGTDIRLVGEAKDRFKFSVECKYCESWSIPAWIEQAKSNQNKDTNWILFIKKNRHEEIAVLNAEVFFEIMKELEGYKLAQKS